MVLKAIAAYRKFSNTFASPWLMKCNDNQEYIVKFANEKNDKSIVNELVIGKLAKKLDLPVADPVLIEIDKDLIENTKDLKDRNIKPGIHVGTKLINSAYNVNSQVVKEIKENKIENIKKVPDMIAFDIFVNNTDRHGGNSLLVPVDDSRDKFEYIMIDHGHCLGGNDWKEEDVKKLPLRLSNIPWKKGLINEESFNNIIGNIDNITMEDLRNIINMIPKEWGISENEKEAIVEVLSKRDKKSMTEFIKNNLSKISG